jgi:soluble lytic murein transglycosylase-like protein
VSPSEVHPQRSDNILRINFLRCCVAAGVVWGAAVSPAVAQIYSWRDANGRLVLASRPRGEASAAVPVGTTASVPATPVSFRPRGAFSDLIAEHATAHGLDPNLVRAVIQVESAFNPRAVSPKGAMGLMQLMPATASEFGVSDPFDPAENIRAGVAYLRRLLDRYENRVELALAAYNAGPGAVDKYGERIPPYRETQNYVRKIKSVTEIRMGAKRVIYKIVEIVDGREVPRYSDTRPAGDYDVVTRR